MLFVKTDALSPGMRLAKPIYNKNGVLLYERGSRLTLPAINSVHNFGLIGIYILEPAEPVPPFSKEDLEYEQFQTVYTFKLRDIFEKIQKRLPIDSLPSVAEKVIERYGTLRHRVNFNQNLRSADDFIYKHAISTAILSAMMSHFINMSEEDCQSLIIASLIYGFGYRFVPHNILNQEEPLSPEQQTIVQFSLEKGLSYLRIHVSESPVLRKAIAVAEYHILSTNPERNKNDAHESIILLAEILKIAEQFDLMTGMNCGHKPESEIIAMNYLLDNRAIFSEPLVSILAKCIHIIPAGASVDLSTGDKAIVLVENTINFMRPVILRYSDNTIYDLSDDTLAERFQIVDLMKTMDNRVEIDEHTLEHFVADERLAEMTKRFREALKNS